MPKTSDAGAPLDLDAPVKSLREVAGLSLGDVGDQFGQARASIANAQRRGDGVTLGWLRRLCDAIGYELELRVRKKNDAPPGGRPGGPPRCAAT